ncbi:MAG: DNA adenine methylase [Chthoniobacterales bacterium]|nr:DNA adenine methylase [Chthoniobacterales bacterium]
MSRYKTPLRYPGGKQKLAPFIEEIIEENSLDGGDYAEPYAGGAGVAIELLLRGTVGHIHLNDSCDGVYAFWHSIIRNTEAFCRRVSGASLTIKEWQRQKEILSRPKEFDLLDVGFSMFYLNRCNRSGIISAGVIGGLNQSGRWKMDARFSRNNLITRIEAIGAKAESISIMNWDAERFLKKYLPLLPKKSLIYCDPPYFHKAERLYLNHYHAADHARLAKVILKLRQPWLVSYDTAREILDYYSEQRSFDYTLQYNAAKAYLGSEVFFFSGRLKLPARSSIESIDIALQNLSLRS